MRLNERTVSWGGFAVAVLLQAIVGWVIYTNTHALIHQDHLVSDALSERAELFNIFTRVLDAESATRGYLITGEPSHLETYRRSKETLLQELDILRAQANDKPMERDLIGRLEPELQKEMGWLAQQISFAQTRHLDDGRKLTMTQTGAVMMGEVRETLRTMIEEEQASLDNLRIEATAASRTMIRWLTLGGAFSLGLMVIIFAFLRSEIDKRRAAQRALAQARDAALQSAQMKSEFLANMSHEIRTPMNAVIGMTDLLAESRLTAEQRDYVQVVRKSGDALIALIDDVLDLSKIEAGKLRLETVDFDLRERVENVADLLADRAHAKGLELTTLIDPELPGLLSGDPVRMGQVLSNLVSNAIKFTSQGGVFVAVRVEGKDAGRRIVFEVKDSGIGLSADAQKKLFQPFMQADGSTTRKYGGTGLGLAISRQLVEMMGGEIGVESAEGQGSSFWFRIPFRSGAASSSDSLTLSGRPTVLLFTANTSTQQVLQSYLHALGVVPVMAAKNDALKDRGPALAVIVEKGEVMLDDLSLVQRLKKHPALGETPVLYVTSLRDKPALEDLRQWQMTLSLTKPLKMGTLAMVLRGLALFQTSSPTSPLPTSPPAPIKEIPKAIESRTDSPGKARILLVEDNEINQTVAFARLGKYGFQPNLAQNGKEAVAAAKETTFDLILMDCQMPEMDGYQATQAIRQQEGTGRRTPIIALTAHAIPGDREKCLAAGMDDYLSKPFKPEELQATLEKWLGFHLNASPDSVDDLPKQLDPPISLNILRDVTNNAVDRMAHLADVFVKNGWGSVQKLEAALTIQDFRALGQVTHGYAGSSASFGADRLALLVREMEAAAKTKDWARAKDVLGDIKLEMTAVNAYLRKELAF
jgi:two-component system sensor histidine kinase/response regulator